MRILPLRSAELDDVADRAKRLGELPFVRGVTGCYSPGCCSERSTMAAAERVVKLRYGSLVAMGPATP